MDNTVFDTLKHSNVARKAKYRRVHKYVKSLGKFKAEKLRRKQALELADRGLSIERIALALGVSERTINRDLKKMMIYIKKLQTQLRHQEGEAALKNLSFKKQLCLFKELEQRKRRILRPRRCRSLHISIDLDQALLGKYAMSYKPKLPVEMAENGKITIELLAHGKNQNIARIYVGKIAGEAVNLDTNKSLYTVTPFALKGLQITELTELAKTEKISDKTSELKSSPSRALESKFETD